MFNRRKHIGLDSGFNSSPLAQRRTSGGVFFNNFSFLIDGTNEQFTIPNADLSTILQGNVTASLNFVFYPLTQINFLLWSNGTTNRGIYIYWLSSSIGIRYNRVSDGTLRQINFPASAFVINAWNFVTFTIDTSTGQGTLKANGVEITLSSSTMGVGDLVINNVDNFILGGGGTAGFTNLNGYINQMSIVNRIISLSEHQDWYNSGKPLSSQDFFDIDNKLFFNSDNSGSVAQFSVVDSVNSITATSENLETADKVSFVPYI